MELYKAMRKKAKISSDNENSDGSDFETEQDFKTLRPDAGYKLMDLLTGKVKEPKKKMHRRRAPQTAYSLADPAMEAIMMGTKKPYETHNLAQENKKKRMLRRAGFFNPAGRNMPRARTYTNELARKI